MILEALIVAAGIVLAAAVFGFMSDHNARIRRRRARGMRRAHRRAR